MTKDEALKLALDAHQAMREWIDAVPDDTVLPAMPGCDRDWLDTVEAALKQALAQPAPVQPVAFEVGLVEWVGNKLMATPKVTTTPPAAQRQWVGLTVEELSDFDVDPVEAKAMIQRLKEKNT
jgi:hypothetical protein